MVVSYSRIQYTTMGVNTGLPSAKYTLLILLALGDEISPSPIPLVNILLKAWLPDAILTPVKYTLLILLR